MYKLVQHDMYVQVNFAARGSIHDVGFSSSPKLEVARNSFSHSALAYVVDKPGESDKRHYLPEDCTLPTGEKGNSVKLAPCS